MCFQACKDQATTYTEMREQEIQEEVGEAKALLLSTLESKYAESFKLVDFYFEKGLNLYVFQASPKSNTDIVFEGTFDERKDNANERISHDAYPNMKFSHAASQFYVALFKQIDLPHYASASVVTDYVHPWGDKVPSWDQYLQNRSAKSTIRMNTYYFDVPDDAGHEIVVHQKAILEALHSKYHNNYSLFVGFWPSGFLEGKKLEDLTFGFTATSEKDADNLLNTMQYLSKVLFIKIVNGSIEGLDEQQLFDLIQDDNKNGPNEMVEM